MVLEVMAEGIPMKEVSETTTDREEMVSTGQPLAKIKGYMSNKYHRVGIFYLIRRDQSFGSTHHSSAFQHTIYIGIS